MAKRKKRKNFLSDTYKTWIFMILLLCLLPVLLLATLYIQNNLLIPKIKAEFAKYNLSVLEKKDLSIWWISDDNLNIINDNSKGIELEISNCEKDNSLERFYKITGELMPIVDKIFKKAGFTKNLKNSSKDIKDNQFYDYVLAYEKDNKKCIFRADPDCSSGLKKDPAHYTFSFACTDNFTNNYQIQAPYLKNFEINDAVIHVDKKIDNFITFNVNYRRSGYYIITKLINGKLTKVFEGQDYPSCLVVNQYQIPKEIAPNCY